MFNDPEKIVEFVANPNEMIFFREENFDGAARVLTFFTADDLMSIMSKNKRVEVWRIKPKGFIKAGKQKASYYKGTICEYSEDDQEISFKIVLIHNSKEGMASITRNSLYNFENGFNKKIINEEQKEMTPIKYTRLSETAVVPVKAHLTDGGFDLYADETVRIRYGNTEKVATNIAIELPEGYVADIRGRSGMTLKTPVRVQYGTIDAGFRDGLSIIIENDNHAAAFDFLLEAIKYYTKQQKPDEFIQETLGLIENRRNLDLVINKGDKIAQLVVHKLPDVEFIEGKLQDSERGKNGFGSTGVN